MPGATRPPAPAETTDRPAWWSALGATERELAVPSGPPAHAHVMRAVLDRQPFSDPNWMFERKLDGIRCLGVRSGGQTRLLSRNDHSLSARYPEIRDALAAQAASRFAVDGEVVAFDGAQTSFAKLARRGLEPVPVFFYIFDLLWLDGFDIRELGLRTRKRLLGATLTFADPLRLTNHRNGEGEAMFRMACQRGWEGVIGKRADSPYRDARSRDWLKFKCEAGQELVIGGFTAPRGSRTDLGALLVGYYDGDRLRYAGKVGTGFDTKTLHSLGRRLNELRREDAPFADAAQIKERTATWVEPRLVAQIGFTEWTRAGRLRHPRFEGLRDDKAATEVVREDRNAVSGR